MRSGSKQPSITFLPDHLTFFFYHPSIRPSIHTHHTLCT